MFRTFMQANDLQFMIRGHATPTGPEDGYDLHFGSKLLTVSSETKEPTVIFAEPGKKLRCTGPNAIPDVPPTLRFVQLEDQSDASPTNGKASQ